MDAGSLQKSVMEFNSEGKEEINLIGFKKHLNNLSCLTQEAIDNFARFMDSNNNGYISIAEYITKVNNAANRGPATDMNASMSHNRTTTG